MLMAGAPFREPIFPYGPFVMNTREEIVQAAIAGVPEEALLRPYREGGWNSRQVIHHLAAGPFPRCGPETALPPLLERAILKPVMGVGGQLELLRNIQGLASK